jgi:guanylate kinase
MVRARSPGVWLPVPVTTRPRRDREVDGDGYRFIDQAAFARMIETGALLEWAELGGRWYGTPRGPVVARLRGGVPVLLAIDLRGARAVRRLIPEARLVLLAPPGWDPTLADVNLAAEVDITIVTDSIERAADELVRLLGSPALLQK